LLLLLLLLVVCLAACFNAQSLNRQSEVNLLNGIGARVLTGSGADTGTDAGATGPWCATESGSRSKLTNTSATIGEVSAAPTECICMCLCICVFALLVLAGKGEEGGSSDSLASREGQWWDFNVCWVRMSSLVLRLKLLERGQVVLVLGDGDGE
jgi:hypothetical protein